METNTPPVHIWIAAQIANEAALAEVLKKQADFQEAERRIREMLVRNQERIDAGLTEISRLAMQSAEILVLQPPAAASATPDFVEAVASEASSVTIAAA
jgi:hypothetical protein